MTNEMKNNQLPARLSELMRNVTGDKPVSIRPDCTMQYIKSIKGFIGSLHFLLLAFRQSVMG